MEMIMKHETFVAVNCRGICVLGAFVLLTGTSAALAQSPATPADKPATKTAPAPAVTQPAAKEKMDSTMPGMPGMSAGGGDMRRIHDGHDEEYGRDETDRKHGPGFRGNDEGAP